MWFPSPNSGSFAKSLAVCRGPAGECHREFYSLNFWLVAGLGWGIEAVLWSNIVASVLTTPLVLGVLTRKQLSGRFDTSLLKNSAACSDCPYVPNGPSGMRVNEFLDRFYLNAMNPERYPSVSIRTDYTAEDITGIYNATYKLAIFMTLGVQMFRMAWQPFFMKYAAAQDNRTLFSRGCSTGSM